MKILVCGGRNYYSPSITDILDKYINKNDIIIHGDCNIGVDLITQRWANSNCIKTKPYPAAWKKHGKAAGSIRNQLMIDDNPDIDFVLAFPGGKGTADMINRAKNIGLKIIEPYIVFKIKEGEED